MEAVARYVMAPATVMGDIGDLPSERHALEKSKNRNILLSILSYIRYLGFAIKRKLKHWNNVWGELQFSSAAEFTGSRKSRDHCVASEKRWEIHITRDSDWAARGNGSWHDAANIQNVTFFTIMADETEDVSHKEQLFICIRWVDDCQTSLWGDGFRHQITTHRPHALSLPSKRALHWQVPLLDWISQVEV